MTEQQEQQQEQGPELESSGETPHSERGTPEKFWDATVKTWSSATFRANQYRRVVQKKIDVTSIHKKIATAHADLGKLIDDLRQTEESDLIGHNEVQEQLQKLDSLRSAAATLEEEIVAIKAEEPSPEMDMEDDRTEH